MDAGIADCSRKFTSPKNHQVTYVALTRTRLRTASFSVHRPLPDRPVSDDAANAALHELLLLLLCAL